MLIMSTFSVVLNTNQSTSSVVFSTNQSTIFCGYIKQCLLLMYKPLKNILLFFRSLSSNYRTSTSISILDTPGFQNPASCGRQTGATFEDLCHNYTQERLQLLFHDITFTMQQDRYSQVIFLFIRNLDIFPLISPTDIFSIKEMSLILKNIGQGGVKHIMILLIKTITSVLKLLEYISSSYWTHFITSDHFCLDL